MSRFADLRLIDFLDALASNTPTPGGGTAAAIAGAMGTALLMMVAGLPKSRSGRNEERVALSEAAASLASLRDRFTALADSDSEAFDRVMAAYRLPKTTPDEQEKRKDAIELALRGATAAPLDTLRATGEAMELAIVVATHGNRTAVSDAGVGIALLQTASDGAAANVKINLESMTDETFKATAARDADAIAARVSDARRLSEAALVQR